MTAFSSTSWQKPPENNYKRPFSNYCIRVEGVASLVSEISDHKLL